MHHSLEYVDCDNSICYHVIMVRTQIQLTPEQANRVKKLAVSRGLSMAKVIRNAIDAAIAADAEAVSKSKRSRALEAVGGFRSGRKDISRRHDAYLDEAFKD